VQFGIVPSAGRRGDEETAWAQHAPRLPNCGDGIVQEEEAVDRRDTIERSIRQRQVAKITSNRGTLSIGDHRLVTIIVRMSQPSREHNMCAPPGCFDRIVWRGGLKGYRRPVMLRPRIELGQLGRLWG
jgi:hypothetical protein